MSNTYTTKKALKIATALYMITDIMSEKEPLKWHLRNCAVSLLEADDRNMDSVIERTIDILTISRIARAVAKMNADVLEDELKALLSQIQAERGVVANDEPLFQKSFFEIKETLKIETPVLKKEIEIQVNKEEIEAPIIEKKIIEEVIEPITPKQAETEIEDNEETLPPVVEEVVVERPTTTLIPQGIKSAFSPRVTLVESGILPRKDQSDMNAKFNRRDVILETIRSKDNCSIKDIAIKLPTLSEKTIQRELVAMTEEGLLIKAGDRRWSTYSVSRR